jgi:hypothetical protein
MLHWIKQRMVIMAISAVLPLSQSALFADEPVKENGEKVEKSATETEDDSYQPPKAILEGKKIRYSGYGGPSVRFAGINNQFSLFTGGKGGMIINDSLVLGGAGYGMLLPDYSGTYGRFRPGYGGFLLEYILFPKSIINFSLGTLIGAGNAGDSTFFILEPEINVFVNITRYFKIGISGAYRYTSGMNAGALNDESFRGFSAGLVFEFGKF